MLCCRCKKNLAVVYITKMEPDGTSKNEGYCLTCAKELNLGPVNDIMKNMGINPEEMDSLNREMSEMMEEMGDGDLQGLMGGFSVGDDDDDENMSRSMQKNPLDFLSKMLGGNKEKKEDEKAENKKEAKEGKKKDKKRKNLNHFGVNLTEKAKRGEIDAVIGRDVEMERTAQILNRRTKNNPCLIGEPGVV